MGYYVHITDADWYIPTDKQDAAYKAVCALNERNDLKRGGTYPRPEGLEQTTGANDHLWFAWMDAYYPDTCPNLHAVLEQVGFDLEELDEGLAIRGYNNKSGQEELFLSALAPFAESIYADEPLINWMGEEGEMWQDAARDGKMFQQQITMATHGAATEYVPQRY